MANLINKLNSECNNDQKFKKKKILRKKKKKKKKQSLVLHGNEDTTIHYMIKRENLLVKKNYVIFNGNFSFIMVGFQVSIVQHLLPLMHYLFQELMVMKMTKENDGVLLIKELKEY